MLSVIDASTLPESTWKREDLDRWFMRTIATCVCQPRRLIHNTSHIVVETGARASSM